MLRRMPFAPASAILAALVILAGSCAPRRAALEDPWVDPNPLPADTATVPLPEPGVHGGRFVIAQTASPKTFNAVTGNESATTDVTNRMYASLVDWDPETRQSVPLLARSWSRSDDGLTYSFRLRRGIRFSDGAPITAADVLFSFEVVFDPVLHPSVQDLLKIRGKPYEVSAPDSLTILVRIPSVTRTAINAISSVRILPKHVLEAPFRAGAFASTYLTSAPPESVVTSGAFRLKEFRAGEKTVLERNPYWFRVDARGSRLPYLDELVFLTVPDQAAAALKFQSGEIDALDNVNNEDYQTFERGQRQGNYTMHTLGPSLNTSFVWFNLNRVRESKGGRRAGEPWVGPVKYAWFSSPAFRRAVSRAIDRDAIIRGPFFGQGVKCWSNATPSNPWTSDGFVHDDYDPAGARRLLDSLGFADRDGDGVREDAGGHALEFSLKTNANNNMRVAMANLIRDDLAKVGIRVHATPMDFIALVANTRDDFQYEAVLLGLQSGVPPDPAMGQNFWRPSGSIHYWSLMQEKPETEAEARILELLEENLASLDSTVQRRTWQEMQNTLNEQAFVIYLPVPIIKVPVRNGFGNLAPNIVPHRLLWNIERVFARPGHRGA